MTTNNNIDYDNLPSGQYTVKISNIKWDTFDEDTGETYTADECGLPTGEFEFKVEHEQGYDFADEITDQLSDEYGYCHYGCNFEFISEVNE